MANREKKSNIKRAKGKHERTESNPNEANIYQRKPQPETYLRNVLEAK